MKVKITADGVLEIIKGILTDEEVNIVIDDEQSPKEWKGKRIMDILNAEFYAFKHRPATTEQLALEIMSQGNKPPSEDISGTSRSFCLVELLNTERTFARNIDNVSVVANVEFWIQTEKVPLLEYLFEGVAATHSGLRFNVNINGEMRQCLTSFDNFAVNEVDPEEYIGEASICNFAVTMILQPAAANYADYKVEFYIKDHWVDFPFNTLQFISTMTQKALPSVNAQFTSAINLSNSKGFAFTFDSYQNDFIDWLISYAFNMENELFENTEKPQMIVNNNEIVMMKLTRNDRSYIYNCVVKDHQINIQNDISNESNSLVLTIRGI